MIRLFDDWIVDVDERNYILARDTGKKIITNSKTGKTSEVETRDIHGYYQSLSGALIGLSKEIARRKLSDGSMSLSEAVKAISESNQRVADLITQTVRS